MDLQNQLKSEKSNEDKNPTSNPPQSSSVSVKSEKKTHELKINFKAIFNWLIFLLILCAFTYAGYNFYRAYIYQPQANANEIKIIEDQATIQRINGSIEQGNNVSPSESGYGRPDPFANY